MGNEESKAADEATNAAIPNVSKKATTEEILAAEEQNATPTEIIQVGVHVRVHTNATSYR